MYSEYNKGVLQKVKMILHHSMIPLRVPSYLLCEYAHIGQLCEGRPSKPAMCNLVDLFKSQNFHLLRTLLLYFQD